MVLLLTHAEVCASVTMHDALEAMEGAFREQGEGHVTQPARLNVKSGKGWLRLGPAIMEGSGWMGYKAMHLTPGLGMRYVVHLYRVSDGELVAIMDAQHLTTLRTGATSAVATRRLARPGATSVAVLGAGAEARAQVDAMHALGLVRDVRVFSRTPANRQRFAAEVERELGPTAIAVDSAREAVDGAAIILAAVKSTETVLHGAFLEPGVHVNSIGTARPDQREIDPETFTRAAVIVVDTRAGVFGEAGDAIAARTSIDPEHVHELADLVVGNAPGRGSDQDITLFKSVGTAVQDVAMAACIFERANLRRLGRDLGEFPIVKAS